MNTEKSLLENENEPSCLGAVSGSTVVKSDKFKLKRTVQCAKCPWKVDTDPYEIPDGYCEIKHKNLEDTIAKENDFGFGKALKIMACHHSKDTGENAEHCVGWLNHQLGRGNNIGLRMSMMRCENIKDLKIVGEQHERFEDTLPDSEDW